MASYVEIERKYDVERHVITPPLHDLPGVASVAQPERHDLDATYFDTAELTLASARFTLRRRTGGDDAGWHLKLPGAGDRREELRLPLGLGSESVPEVLLQRVLAQVRDHALRPVATIRTKRLVHRLLDEHGEVLAEFCDDNVSAERLHPDRLSLTWREWELELVNGDPGLLGEAERLITAAGARRAAGPSKLSRVLGTAVTGPPPESPPDVGEDASTGQVLSRYVAEMVARIEEQDPLVRQDAEDAVHQMRVACRRLRSVLATYRPILRRDETDPLRDELRWLSGELSLARDSEVMQARLDTAVRAEPAELLLGPVVQRVDAFLHDSRRTGRRQAEGALDSDRYLRLLDALSSLVDHPPFVAAADGRARTVLPGMLQRDWKRMRKRVERVDAASVREAREHAVHEVRKAAKRLRYAADSATPVLGDRAAELSGLAEQVQDVLGEHQDTVVARDMLRTMGVRAHLAGENGFTFGLLHAREGARAEQLRQDYRELLAGFPATKLKRWLRG